MRFSGVVLESEAKKSEFNWQAPDGSNVFVAHLADPIGYSNARHMPLSPEEFVTRVELLIAIFFRKPIPLRYSL